LNLLIIPLVIPAPYQVRGKLQQESISSGSLFSQGQAWIPVSTGMTELNMENQPFDYPRSEPRGLLRVDTERRFLPRPEGRGLAPSKYQKQLSSGT